MVDLVGLGSIKEMQKEKTLQIFSAESLILGIVFYFGFVFQNPWPLVYFSVCTVL